MTLFVGVVWFGLTTVRSRHKQFRIKSNNESRQYLYRNAQQIVKVVEQLGDDIETDCDSQSTRSSAAMTTIDLPTSNINAVSASTAMKEQTSASASSSLSASSIEITTNDIRVAPVCDTVIALTDEQKRADGICHVCRQLVDGWSADPDTHLSIRTISGGITNLLFAVTNRGKTVLVRIFGANTDVMIDREGEAKVFAVLSHNGFGPYLHGSFSNGRIEGFFSNAPNLEPNQMGERSPIDYPTLIAHQLSRMHGLDMPLDREPTLWPVLNKWASMAENVTLPEGSSKAQVLDQINVSKCQQQLAWVMHELPSAHNNHGMDLLAAVAQEDGQRSPEASAMRLLFQSVFAHNDLLSGNVLSLAESEKRVQLIDFEYGAYNYLGFDIANHFCEYAGFDFNLGRWYPSNDAKTHFLKSYVASLVAEKSELVAVLPPYVVKRFSGDSDSVSTRDKDDEDEVLFFRALCKWVDRFALASHLYWGFWAVVQEVSSPIDFDFVGYGKLRFEGFLEHQRQFFPSASLATVGGAAAGCAKEMQRGGC